MRATLLLDEAQHIYGLLDHVIGSGGHQTFLWLISPGHRNCFHACVMSCLHVAC